jgi:hypothetical protein
MRRGKPSHPLWILINSEENIKQKFIDLIHDIPSIEIQRILRNQGFEGKTYDLSKSMISIWKRRLGIKSSRGRPEKIYIPDD